MNPSLALTPVLPLAYPHVPSGGKKQNIDLFQSDHDEPLIKDVFFILQFHIYSGGQVRLWGVWRDVNVI